MIFAISLLPCAYKQLFGFSCPLCGFQRSMLLLCKGQVWDSICMFPPWPFMAGWLTAFIVAMICGKGKQYIRLKWPWFVLLTTLVGNMIWQNCK
ncbi:MAG: DUF2752 domain-containing protein [Paludibacteraceae bacterium]